LKLDVDLLMEIQYNLPLSTTPLVDLAENLNRKTEDVLKTLKLYSKIGILKRYGLNLNYKSFPRYRQAALVGLKSSSYEVVKRINEFDDVRVKHNYLRDSDYRVWFTLKGRDLKEIERIVKEICRNCNYVILPTKRIYKMDVKFDLHRGISWSEKRNPEPKDVPTIKELGLNEAFVRRLGKLEICERPFLNMGYSEEEVVSVIEELLKRGIARDFCGVLSESKIGFRENGMTVLRVSEDVEVVALELLRRFPQITHLIERIPCSDWSYQLYFVVHARSRKPIENLRDEVSRIRGVEEVKVIYSLKNLREPSL